jgi:hypothetical protein
MSNQKLKSAKATAEELSRRYPDRIFRVYSTPSGSYWVRGDQEILSQIDGVRVVVLDSYENGESLG